MLPTTALAALLLLAPPQSPELGPVALLCEKALPCPLDPDARQVVHDAVVLVRDGRIEAVGERAELAIPADARVLDLGDAWVVPGFIDLHSHIGAGFDWAVHVYLANPGPRVSAAVVPGDTLLRRAVAGGVTSTLLIPGSGTNIGGQGVLLKIAPERYEDMVLRDPGSLKLAQAGNPESWTIGVSRALMNWNTRSVLRRGLAYARRWAEFEASGGERPEVDLSFEVFRDLAAKRTQFSVHTQMYQVVLRTITMLREEFDFDAYIDHGSFDGWRAAALAEERDVPAILGPRMVNYTMRGDVGGPAPYRIEIDSDGRLDGLAARYQESGHSQIGFNTDSIPPPFGGIQTEELSLQAAMACRYGFDTSHVEAVRGLTIVPARAAGLEHRIGSLEPGKDADILVVDGDPIDPRTRVRAVWVDGVRVYDVERDGQRW